MTSLEKIVPEACPLKSVLGFVTVKKCIILKKGFMLIFCHLTFRIVNNLQYLCMSNIFNTKNIRPAINPTKISSFIKFLCITV